VLSAANRLSNLRGLMVKCKQNVAQVETGGTQAYVHSPVDTPPLGRIRQAAKPKR